MVRKNKLHPSQRVEEKLEQLEENMNVAKKDKLFADPPEEEIQQNQLQNPIKNFHHLDSLPSRETGAWMGLNEKEKSYETDKEYIGEEDQFFRGEKLYGYKDPAHKIGPLVAPDYSPMIDQVESGKDEAIKLMSQIFKLMGRDDIDRSFGVTGYLPTIYQSAILASLLHPQLSPGPSVKLEDTDNLNLLPVSDIHTPHKLMHYHKPGGTNRSQIKDIPQQNGSQKKTQLGSGDVPKNYSGEQSLPFVKNLSFYDSRDTDIASKKNLSYAAEDSDFNTSHENGHGDDLGAYEMVVLYQNQRHRVQLSRTREGQPREILEIAHLVFNSKTSKHSVDSQEVRIRSFDGGHIIDKNRHAWTDSGGRGIPDHSGRQPGLAPKDEEMEKSGGNTINKNFPRLSGLKRKNSLDVFLHGDKRHKDHPEENWTNIDVDPMLKIDTAFLPLWPDTSSGTKKSQKEQIDRDQGDQQDIFSSLSESLNPAVTSSGANGRSDGSSSAASLNSLHHDTKEYEDSSTGEGQTDDSEQKSGEDAAVSQSDSLKQNKDNDTSEDDSHGHVASKEKNSSHSEVNQGRTVSDNKAEKGELPRERKKAKQSTDEEVSSSTNSPDSRGMATATVCSSNNCEHLNDMEIDGSSVAPISHVLDQAVPISHVLDQAVPISHVLDQAVPDCPSSLLLSQGSSVEGTPTLTFHTPVQISSPADSGLTHTTFRDYYKEPFEWSIFSPPDKDKAFVYSKDNPLTTQETQSQSSLGACGGHTSVIAQEDACYFHLGSHPDDDWGPSVAEESVFSFMPYHHGEQHPVQSDSHSAAHLHHSVPQEPSFQQNRVQAVPPPASHLDPLLSESTSYSHHTHFQPISVFPSHPTPVHLTPVIVHAAAAIPPWATSTTRINLAQATNPEFVELRQRRATFSDSWHCHSGIDAANMALAGFFNRGRGHGVRCFYCGLELYHLTSAHNIWDEHVRHNPHCPYLVAIMGHDFVQQTLRRLRDDNNDSAKSNDKDNTRH